MRGDTPVPLVHVILAVLVLLAPAASVFAQALDAPREAPGGPGDTIRYRLEVEGPNPPTDAIREGLDLTRWQADEGMTLELLQRLVKEALPQAREIAAIEGFYSASVDADIERDGERYVVRMRVDPGKPSRVTRVDLDIRGPATTDVPLGTGAVREARARWDLNLGEVFRQAAWIDAKAKTLLELKRGPYPAAKIAHSEARVEPATLAAELDVDIDSGPPFRIGAVDVVGTQRYTSELVKNFSTLERGEPYTQAKLDDYVRRLAASGYFTSVQASVDPETANPDDATVNVSVIEAPTHRFEGGLSYSTDTGYGTRARYTNINVDGKAMQFRADARFEARLQLTEFTFTWPPTAAHWIDSVRIGAQRRDVENTVETSGTVGYERRGIDERGHWVFGAAYLYDRQAPKDAATTTSYATYVESGYVMRRVDDLLLPSRGYMLDVRVGGGVPGVSTEGFGRVVALSRYWYPINRMTGLVFRAEAGAVLGASRQNVPSVLRFRTGGDTSVRGYAYQSLGVREGDGIVGGRYYAVASAEVVRWINETWGVAAFVDAGDAADSLSDLDPALGYGIGARLRTPIGPFRLDVAYGDETRKVRLHFSVGVNF